MGKVTTSRELQKSSFLCSSALFPYLAQKYAIFTYAPLSWVFSRQIHSVGWHHTQQLLIRVKTLQFTAPIIFVSDISNLLLIQISWTPSPSLKSTCFLGIALEEEAIKPLSLCNFSASTVLSHYRSLSSLDASRSNFSCRVRRPANFPEGSGRKRKIKMILWINVL